MQKVAFRVWPDFPSNRRKTTLAAILFLAVFMPGAAQQITLPLWPQGAPEASSADTTEHDMTAPSSALQAGKRVTRLTDVSKPTLTVYKAGGDKNTGAAVLVFPGGGYKVLAYDLEGTEACDWLNSIGVTCVLVKYRVPFNDRYPKNRADLEDAQQAMRLTRAHAAEWHIDPRKIGVLGFSAGAHLAAVLSIHANDDRKEQSDASPNFALIIYPGYLVDDHDLTKLSEGVQPTATTCPTFLVQAEDDPVHEENVLVYFEALKQAKVPAELHIFTEGRHGYGLRPTEFPVTSWPSYAATWLHTIHILELKP
jgi:acetyl esterase/lipase